MSQSFTLTQKFAASREHVLAARERRFEDLSKHDGVKKQEILSETHEGAVKITKRAFSLADKVPDMVKSMMPAGFLNLTETARFDTETKTNRFDVTYEQNPDRMQIKGETKYIDEGENSSRREYNITVKVNIPLVGSLLEIQIASSFKKGIEKDYQNIQDILAAEK
ncbi:MAG TPA: DUF2505 domain-containing protein [Turneriella sp.]|nr:DUF2505 domain-containing protein [Turneriella sp.]